MIDVEYRQQGRRQRTRQLRNRVLYAFDSRHVALLLLGGDKTGDGRWYEKAMPQAEKIYAKHLEELR